MEPLEEVRRPVMRVRLNGDRVLGYEPLIDGFQHDEKAQGWLADMLVMPDGALLVADDIAGAVYRVTYAPAATVVRKKQPSASCGALSRAARVRHSMRQFAASMRDRFPYGRSE